MIINKIREEIEASRIQLLHSLNFEQTLIQVTLCIPTRARIKESIQDVIFFDAISKLTGHLTEFNPATFNNSKLNKCHYIRVNATPEKIKSLTLSLEKSSLWATLWDIDVFDNKGNKISRKMLGEQPRKCLCCSEPAKLCAALSSHTGIELENAVMKLIIKQ
ncbi:citrate lyase holo-[acyl-carrier protein] synthase [Paenibacillus pinihumi]|uniref:citrate lyase holo-[acyl-carrier protein] synthase n=1 Tax=Paenibacillus pinihumi TaxID=669462 RepID=UPI00048E2833|nr:citrate lyase holo-[acyl-carrier protein] synthase [Paenibacillus pinihumi]